MNLRSTVKISNHRAIPTSKGGGFVLLVQTEDNHGILKQFQWLQPRNGKCSNMMFSLKLYISAPLKSFYSAVVIQT